MLTGVLLPVVEATSQVDGPAHGCTNREGRLDDVEDAVAVVHDIDDEDIPQPPGVVGLAVFSTVTTACCTTLSSSEAMPSARCRPSALGMSTRRDGLARYAPV